jgi:hypothetical protein
MQEFTQNDLLQYYYHETSPAKTLAIKLALITDSTLYEQMAELEDSIRLLDKLVVGSPSSKTIKKLLELRNSDKEEDQ